jgi:23S rRNA pseudouridine955/2504/2580 synthase
VKAEDDGQRLDRWFKKHFPQMPYALLQKMVRKGQIRVDGGRAETGSRLSSGQEIRIPPFSGGRKDDEWFRPMPDDAEYIRSLLIYDDGDIMAINKPAGIASQGGMRIARHIDGLLVHLENWQGMRPKLVHRLDRDTSGVMLMARSRDMAARLGRSISGSNVKKVYWAIVMPAPRRDAGIIDIPLGKGEGVSKDKVVVDHENGKKAVTEYRVVERAGREAAFVAFRLHTGRTHQIRVHAAASGFPLFGDTKYREHHDSGILEGVSGEIRLHLHSRILVLPNPGKKGLLRFEAPLPEDLLQGWTEFGFSVNLESDPFPDHEFFK